MKKFKFKLQPLLKYRQYQEKVAQQKTAKAHMDVKKNQLEIISLEQAWDRQAEVVETVAEKGVSASRFQQHYQYLSAVESSIVQEKNRKVELDKILKAKLLELKKKSIDKRAMELYQDRLKAVYMNEMIQLEQKELDEISTLKTARTKRL